MKISSVALSVVVSLAFCVLASAGKAARAPAAESAIRAVLEAQVAAWNRGDVDSFMNGYARSHATEFVSGDTITHGWQTVRDRYAKKYDSRAKMGTLSFSDVEVNALSRDAAVVTGRWKLSRRGDRPRGRFTLIFRKTGDGWRIVHDHTSSPN